MRVSISDMTVFSSLGLGASHLREKMETGERGLSFRHRFSSQIHAPLGEIPWDELGFSHHEASPSDLLLLEGSRRAMKDLKSREASRTNASRQGLFVGTTTFGVSTFYAMQRERGNTGLSVQRLLHPSMQPASLASQLAKDFSIQGPVYTFSTSCIASSQAVAMAFDAIRMNWIDEAYVLGVDILNPTTLHGFQSLQLLDEDFTLPFQSERKGINLSEAIVLLKIERDPEESLIDILSYSAMSEAHHITQPTPSGEPMEETMRSSLEKARIKSSEVDYINPHATGTLANDEAEMQAIQRLFGDLSKAEASKRYTGHALGASGALELAWTALRMQKEDYRYGLKNSFGFGGANLSFSLERGRSR